MQYFFSRELQYNSEKDMLLVTVAFPTHSKKLQQSEQTWPHVFYLQSAQRILELKKNALWVSRTKKPIVFSTLARDSGGS